MSITATPFKKTLKWDIGHAVDGTTDTDLLVPQIVDRAQPVSLQELVYNAIDTGRIAGLKPSINSTSGLSGSPKNCRA